MSEGWREPGIELRVSDVKQYVYCPRIPYYHNVLPVERKVTYKMQAARVEHEVLDRLEKRRSLVKYGLDLGERRFHVPLYSPRLGLHGLLDCLVVTPAGHFPVEFKVTSGEPAVGHKYQLVAYAMLVEECMRVTVRHGFLVLVPGRRIVEVPIMPGARLHVKRLLGAVRRLVEAGRLPAATRVRGRCTDCEYRNYCLDVAPGGRVMLLR